MKDIELKAAAIARLRGLGIEIPDNAGFTIISDAISTIASKRPYNVYREDYVRAWMTPQRVKPCTAEFRPMKVHTHPRLAEIEQAQPPMLTPCGTGNYNEYSKFMLNNGRAR